MAAFSREARRLSADERRQTRQRRAKPLIDDLRLWLEDEGREPEGAPSALPKLAQAPLRASTGMARSVFPFSASWRSLRDCCAASRWTWWPGKRMSLMARLTDWRDRALAGAATALKERERDDRDDEIARLKSKVGEITMDNELLSAKIAAMEGKRPWPTGGRDDEPDALALHCSLFGLSRVARV